LPDLHICVSGFNEALTLAAVTPENGVTGVESFLDRFLEQLPPEARVAKSAHTAEPVATVSTETERARSA